MTGLTRENRTRNWLAWASVFTAVAAAAVLPAAVALAEVEGLIRLIEASAAIPVAGVLGIGALILARRARARTERTLGRVGGARLARLGQLLAVLAVCLALSGAVAIGFYYVLKQIAD